MRSTGQHHLVPLVVACPTKTLSTCKRTILIRTPLFAAAVLARDNIFVPYSDLFFQYPYVLLFAENGQACATFLTDILDAFPNRTRHRRWWTSESHCPYAGEVVVVFAPDNSARGIFMWVIIKWMQTANVLVGWLYRTNSNIIWRPI